MSKPRITAIIILILGILLGWFVFSAGQPNEDPADRFGFKLGLDLLGGTQLIYKADISQVEPGDVSDRMDALRDVVEMRVNLFGVGEPVVQVEKTGIFSDQQGENRLIVELPGITDIDKAVQAIGATPLLEFKEQGPPEAFEAFQARAEELQELHADGTEFTPEEQAELLQLASKMYIDTGLTGRYLKNARLVFNNSAGAVSAPVVAIEFDSEGRKLFADITEKNLGKVLAIFLDGVLISDPVVNVVIPDGKAIIEGGFSPQEAKELAGRLNQGALPIPIQLISSQNVGATLGADALSRGMKAGMIGLVLVALFLILWYRLPGLVATLALGVYLALMLGIFLVFSDFITLTAAGIAGLILSIGMAVDANILIFERLKEEIRQPEKAIDLSIKDGFKRAWISIRDANISSFITAIVLYWFGTSLIKGFALIFGIGILVSMFTAIVVTRNFLLAIGLKGNKTTRAFMNSGLAK